METNSIKVSHVPGESGVWVIIFGDMLVFGLMFITFAYTRRDALTLFQTSGAALNQTCGVLNTVLMLTSSWFVALGMQAVKLRRRPAASYFFAAAFSCGLGFVLVKIYEYTEKITAGIVVNTDDFYMYYFVFTGIHLLHVFAGLIVLAYILKHVRQGAFDVASEGLIESGTLFWHLVDLLWIALFALLYLLK